jgi:hypothetical protein
LTPHLRQEAIQRLTNGEAQADIARSYDVSQSTVSRLTITGHSLKDVCAILDAHYPHRDPALAWNAIRKVEMGIAKRTGNGTNSPNCAPNCAKRV